MGGCRGKIAEQADILWILNGLFASNQILYVQFRIRETRNSPNLSHFKPKLILLASEAVTGPALIWLSVHLAGTRSNCSGYGAKVYLEARGKRLFREYEFRVRTFRSRRRKPCSDWAGSIRLTRLKSSGWAAKTK